jgi:hypothetical protein
MTTATALAINIPLAMIFVALWVAIPLWMIFKHPDRGPETARSVRTVPAYRRAQARPAYAATRSWRVDRLELPVSR